MLQKNQFKKNGHLRNEEGFTLIEIIAVLIILGLLAAVAVPKFTNLTEEAKDKALEGAVAAGMSQASMEYSRQLLETSGGNVTATNLADELNNNPPNNDDFTYTFSEGTNSTILDITVSGKTGSPYEGANDVTKEFRLPN